MIHCDIYIYTVVRNRSNDHEHLLWTQNSAHAPLSPSSIVKSHESYGAPLLESKSSNPFNPYPCFHSQFGQGTSKTLRQRALHPRPDQSDHIGSCADALSDDSDDLLDVQRCSEPTLSSTPRRRQDPRVQCASAGYWFGEVVPDILEKCFTALRPAGFLHLALSFGAWQVETKPWQV